MKALGVEKAKGTLADEFMGEGVFDYNKKKEILNTRFTSSLYDKMRFYYERVERSIT